MNTVKAAHQVNQPWQHCGALSPDVAAQTAGTDAQRPSRQVQCLYEGYSFQDNHKATLNNTPHMAPAAEQHLLP